MTKAVFFDLFFTLIVPNYQQETECDVLGISCEEWEKYAENSELYNERASGKIKDHKEIIQKIMETTPWKVSEAQLNLIVSRREERMRNALLNVDENVLATLKAIKDRNYKICLISNADSIDSMHWNESPMSQLFDDAIFSCDVGILKPELSIYQIAMERLGVTPSDSLFIGDGGSNELYGAKMAGMQTLFTEYFDKKSSEKVANILESADYRVTDFVDILKHLSYK